MASTRRFVSTLFAIWAIGAAGAFALPCFALAGGPACLVIDALQAEKMVADDAVRIKDKHAQITRLEARFQKVFAGPAAALKGYINGIPHEKRSALVKYEGFKDQVDFEKLDPDAYKGIEQYFRQQLTRHQQAHGLNKSECMVKSERCFTDGKDLDNVKNTRVYSMMQPQFDYIKGKPSVYACNYDVQYGKHYLNDAEMADLQKEDPQLAAYFATDLGWKNACLRVQIGTDGKDVVFDTKEFSKRVATALWRAKRTRELAEMNKTFDADRAKAGCLDEAVDASSVASNSVKAGVPGEHIDFDLDPEPASSAGSAKAK